MIYVYYRECIQKTPRAQAVRPRLAVVVVCLRGFLYDKGYMKNLVFGGSGLPDTEFTGTKKKLSTAEGIAFIANETDLDAIELAFVRGVYIKPDAARTLAKTLASLDIGLSIHAPYYINLNPKTDAGKSSSRRLLTASAEVGALLGARNIVFHPASYLGMKPEDAFDAVHSNLYEIADDLAARGVDVVLRPEIGGKLAAFGTVDELIALSRGRDNILPCIDFAHIVARSHGAENSYDAFVAIFKKIEVELGKRALHDMHIHYAGVEYNAKGEICHIDLRDKPAKQSLDYKALARAMADCDVRGMAICESPSKETDALLMKKTYHGFANVH
jgi:deoxyribonuclease IV